jgi:iron complex outermembrane recepter protein
MDWREQLSHRINRPQPSTRQAHRGSSADAGRLDEIVETANRRSENMQNVPISISSVTDSSLASAGIGSTVDLGMVVPGLTFS